MPFEQTLTASANYWSSDNHPADTEYAVLTVLASVYALQPRHLQYKVFGTLAVGAGPTMSAIGRLHNRRLIERSSGGKWRITPAGVAALQLTDELDRDGAA